MVLERLSLDTVVNRRAMATAGIPRSIAWHGDARTFDFTSSSFGR